MKIKKIIDCGEYYALITKHKNPLVYICERNTYYVDDDIYQEKIIDDEQHISEWLLLTDLKTLKKIQ